MSEPSTIDPATIEEVRAFNRRWTERIGLLDAGLLETEHSLTEARVLFELGRTRSLAQVDLRSRLGIDASFLTRVVARLRRRGLVRTVASEDDRRRMVVTLTPGGAKAARLLDRRSTRQVAALLAPVAAPDRPRLLGAMRTIDTLLDPPPAQEPTAGRVELRPADRPGDLGWVVERHGTRYAEEHGFDTTFEALVAQVAGAYGADRSREPAGAPTVEAWIAEVDGERAGSVFCCRRSRRVAQLRLLLVEPQARGLGVGRSLVRRCLGFAVDAGYREVVLWTQSILVAARGIYAAEGFELAEAVPGEAFGQQLVSETWRLPLTRWARST